jgi:hypothetical protein
LTDVCTHCTTSLNTICKSKAPYLEVDGFDRAVLIGICKIATGFLSATGASIVTTSNGDGNIDLTEQVSAEEAMALATITANAANKLRVCRLEIGDSSLLIGVLSL